MPEDLSRRYFLAGTASVAILSAQAGNGSLQVAWIGVGTRGKHLMDMLYKGNPQPFQVVAVCDTYAGNLAAAKDKVQTMGGNTPKTYIDYKELLADKSIDAVVIATPEHLHHQMTLASLAAGKHIYIEKPLAHPIDEGFEIVKAVKKSNRIVQVGTQNRSNS